MVVSSTYSINQKIVHFRKQKWGLQRLHRWLSEWDNFSLLDEQVLLAHILSVLDKNNLAVSKNEVRNCFNAYYNRDYHCSKDSYLKFFYTSFHIKEGAITNPKRSYRIISEPKNPRIKAFQEELSHSKGKILNTEGEEVVCYD